MKNLGNVCQSIVASKSFETDKMIFNFDRCLKQSEKDFASLKVALDKAKQRIMKQNSQNLLVANSDANSYLNNKILVKALDDVNFEKEILVKLNLKSVSENVKSYAKNAL